MSLFDAEQVVLTPNGFGQVIGRRGAIYVVRVNGADRAYAADDLTPITSPQVTASLRQILRAVWGEERG